MAREKFSRPTIGLTICFVFPLLVLVSFSCSPLLALTLNPIPDANLLRWNRSRGGTEDEDEEKELLAENRPADHD
jgi:hypothetical protein